MIDENGEIREEFNGKRIVGLEEGDRILRRKSLEYLRKTEDLRYEEELAKAVELEGSSVYMGPLSDVFVKGGTEELKLVLKELDVYEKAFILSLMPYVGYEDCAIKKGNGSPLGMKDFEDVSGISLRKIYDVLNELKNKCIIYKGKTGSEVQYFMNPWLFYKGNKLNKVLKYMFRNYKVRSKNMKCWKDIK